MIDPEFLNIAAYVADTRVLGPGKRFGLWVQGCPFSCPGCIAPEWIPQRINKIIEINDVTQLILKSDVSGITISGGEPFLQAAALGRLVESIRRKQEINVIVFSGFTYSALMHYPNAERLLSQIDLLIDGNYIASRNSNIGLRGSDNQKFYFMTHRLKNIDYSFENLPRSLEFHFQGKDLLIVGIPAKTDLVLIDQTIESVQTLYS